MFPQVFCFSLPGLLWEQCGPEGALSAGSLHHSSFLSSPLSFFGPSLCFFFLFLCQQYRASKPVMQQLPTAFRGPLSKPMAT